MQHHLRRHKYKLVVSVPMAVLLASSLSLMRDGEEMCIVPEDNTFVEVGETVTLHVFADSEEPINVVGARISAPPELVRITSVRKNDSIIDLWSEEPTIENGHSVYFSGGILREGGFVGNGIVLTIVTQPLAEGRAEIRFDEATMLAHDGTGRDIDCGGNPIVLSIRPKQYPSPDVNADKVVNVFDFGLVSSRLFWAYKQTYDLNMDGRISLSDLGIILTNLGGGTSGQSSLALLSR
jgi:hypothetical protein